MGVLGADDLLPQRLLIFIDSFTGVVDYAKNANRGHAQATVGEIGISAGQFQQGDFSTSKCQ